MQSSSRDYSMNWDFLFLIKLKTYYLPAPICLRKVDIDLSPENRFKHSDGVSFKLEICNIFVLG